MNRYTNVVLTVIAVALTTLAIENAVSQAHAASNIARVAICDPNTNNCASVGQNQYDENHDIKVYRLAIVN